MVYATMECDGFNTVEVTNKTATVQNIMDEWLEANPSTKKRPFIDTYFINDEQLEIPEDPDDALKILNKEISDLGHEAGSVIRVERVAGESKLLIYSWHI